MIIVINPSRLWLERKPGDAELRDVQLLPMIFEGEIGEPLEARLARGK